MSKMSVLHKPDPSPQGFTSITRLKRVGFDTVLLSFLLISVFKTAKLRSRNKTVSTPHTSVACFPLEMKQTGVIKPASHTMHSFYKIISM